MAGIFPPHLEEQDHPDREERSVRVFGAGRLPRDRALCPQLTEIHDVVPVLYKKCTIWHRKKIQTIWRRRKRSGWRQCGIRRGRLDKWMEISETSILTK